MESNSVVVKISLAMLLMTACVGPSRGDDLAAAAAGVALPLTANANVTVDWSAPVGRTSLGLVSANFDWHPNTDEPPNWENCSVQLVDLNNKYLRAAAKAIAPGKLRVGGSEGDEVYYDVDGSGCPPDTAPGMCLSMERWKELGSFAQQTGMSLVFGLNAMRRAGKSDPLNFTNIEAFLRYTKDNDVPVYGFELGNELTEKVEPRTLANDFVALKGFLQEIWPDADGRPKLVGPDDNPNTKYMEAFLKVAGSDMDAVTFHNYVGYGLDPNLAEKMLTSEFMDAGAQRAEPLIALQRTYAPQAEMWVGEIAAAWHSGRPNVTNRFESSLWYADALASMAKRNLTGFLRQTLRGGNYGLLNRTTYEPNPDLYTALLFKQLMGDAAFRVHVDGAGGLLRAYAHCTRHGPSGAVTVLLINLNATAPVTVAGLTGPLASASREVYTLTADSLSSQVMQLNGSPLAVASDGSLPKMSPHSASASGDWSVPPVSVTFVALPDAGVAACHQ